MRITESQLRRIVRKMIKEAPLADLDPPTSFQKEPITGRISKRSVPDPETNFWKDKDFELKSQENPKAEKMKSMVSSPSFRTKLEKLTSSMPIDFYVAPYVAENFLPETAYDLDLQDQDSVWGYNPQNRAKVGTPGEMLAAIQSSTVISDEDKKLFEATINKYIAASGGGKKSCLIIPILRGSRGFEFFTPWMIFHTLFDRGDVFYTHGKGSTPNITGSTRLRGAIRQALYDMQYRLKLTVSEIESIFTMGSARSGWFTKYAQPVDGPGGNTVIEDLANEAAVQALTSEGFNYNKDAWAEIEKKKANSPKTLAKVKSALDRAVAESEKTKAAFIKSIAGKVIIVQGTRDAY